jgi:hypothetical protein
VPFGLGTWTDDAAAIAVELEADDDGPAVAIVAAQIPDTSEVAPGALVVVLGDVASSSGIFGRLLRARRSIPRAIRGSALLARGYVRIGGGIDDASGLDLAWGYAPTS